MPSEETVEVVNESDNVLYCTSLEGCKLKGLLHRSVAIVLINFQDEILPQ